MEFFKNKKNKSDLVQISKTIRAMKDMIELGAARIDLDKYVMYIYRTISWEGKGDTWQKNFKKNAKSYFDIMTIKNGGSPSDCKSEVAIHDIETEKRLG